MISSKKIILRNPEDEDSELYFKWINNKQLVEYNSTFKVVSKKDHNIWFGNITKDKNIKIFSIIEKSNNKLIGSCSLRNINYVSKSAELQIRIGEKLFRNKGLGSEAVKLLVSYGFKFLNLNEIYLHVFENNLRAIKTYEKNKFKKEKLMKKYLDNNNSYKKVYLMVLRKQNY